MLQISTKRVQDKEQLGGKGDPLGIVEAITFGPLWQMVHTQARIDPRK